MTNEEAIKVFDVLKTTVRNQPSYVYEALDVAYEALKNERPKGEWIIDNENEKFICPICEHEIKINRLEYLPAVRWYLKPNFCEECGADMRGGQDNDEAN